MANLADITPGGELYRALMGRFVIRPLREQIEGLDISGAYLVSESFLAHRLEQGEEVVGLKLGMTSLALQEALGVRDPIYGYLTDAMIFDGAMPVPLRSSFIQPRIEGEIAFRLHKELKGHNVKEQLMKQAA